MALTAQHGQVVLHKLFERLSELTREVWSSPKAVQLKEMAQELIAWILELIDRQASQIAHMNPVKFIEGFFRMLKNESKDKVSTYNNNNNNTKLIKTNNMIKMRLKVK